MSSAFTAEPAMTSAKVNKFLKWKPFSYKNFGTVSATAVKNQKPKARPTLQPARQNLPPAPQYSYSLSGDAIPFFDRRKNPEP